jgi:hypothetical protein
VYSVPSEPSDTEIHLELLRREVARARVRLADEDVTAKQQLSLWQVIECHESVIRMLAGSFEAELELIDRELENRLRRYPPTTSSHGRWDCLGPWVSCSD